MFFSQPLRKRFLSLTLAAVAGLAAAAAFAPIRAYPLMFASLAVLFWLTVRAPNVHSAALTGFIWAVVQFAAGLSWTYHSMHVYGMLPAAAAAAGVAALAVILASVPAAVCAAARFFPTSNLLRAVLVLPALWTLGELVRGVAVMGFGWLSTGYALTGTLFSAWAPLVGVYGVGFFAALACGCLAGLMMSESRRTVGVRATCALVLGATVVGTMVVGKATWSSPAGRLEVRVVQPDLPVLLRETAATSRERLERMRSMSERTPVGGTLDVIIWPEGVYARPMQRLPETDRLAALESARKTGAEVFVNAFDEEKRHIFRNSLWRAAPESLSPENVYSKHHLVPFGEYVPFGFRWFVDALRIPMADQVAGTLGGKPVEVAGEPAAVGICYENMFGEELAAWWKEGNPKFVINTANLVWFAPFAAEQFTQMSAMRAQETARPFVQAINNSHSALLLPDGSVGRIAGRGVQNLDMTVPLYAGAPTPFVQWGHWPVTGIALLMLILAALLGRGRRQGRQ